MEVLGKLRLRCLFRQLISGYVKITSLIRKAQLQQRNTKDLRRYHSALETLGIAEKEAMELIQDVENVIAAHKEQGESVQREEMTASRRSSELSTPKIHEREVAGVVLRRDRSIARCLSGCTAS